MLGDDSNSRLFNAFSSPESSAHDFEYSNGKLYIEKKLIKNVKECLKKDEIGIPCKFPIMRVTHSLYASYTHARKYINASTHVFCAKREEILFVYGMTEQFCSQLEICRGEEGGKEELRGGDGKRSTTCCKKSVV